MKYQLKSNLDIINELDSLSYMLESLKEQMSLLHDSYNKIDCRIDKYTYAIEENLSYVYKRLISISDALHHTKDYENEE